MNDPWAEFNPQPMGGMAQPQRRSPVRQLTPPAPPAPRLPPPQTPTQAATDKIELELKRQELEERRKKDSAVKGDLSATANEIRNIIDKAFRAKELSRKGWFATGIGSGLAKGIGGTSAADVDGLLDTIGANTAFEALAKMRASSPTGGALGSITERELDLLKSTVGSLKQTQSDEQFQQQMQNIAESYGRVLAKLPGGRAMMIERGWLPKSKGSAPKQANKPRPQRSRVVDFNDLPE